MKKHLIPITVFLAMFSVLSCGSHDTRVADSRPQAVEADVQAVRGVLDRWVQLYNAEQYDTLITNLYTEDAALMAPGVPIREGREAILSAYRRDAELNAEHIDASVVEDVRVSGDLAVARGWDTGTTTPKSGGSTEKYGLKWLMVLERQGDGAWKFIYEVWNDNSAPPEPAK